LPGWLRFGRGGTPEDRDASKEILAKRVHALESELETARKRLEDLDSDTRREP
jgi:hypothetical protein